MICFRGVLNAPPSRTGTPARYSSGPRTDDRYPRAPELTTAPAKAIAATQPGRVVGLDGIRGLALLFVVLNHIFERAWPGYPPITLRS